jgi:RNA polymerase sigma factor (sigma-70 family)
MAQSLAYSVLNDRDLAEDAVQEAFIQAYLNLSKLQDPAAFPGWLRAIISNHAKRLIRGKRIATIPLDDAHEVASDIAGPYEIAEQLEMKGRVLRAVESLPESERAVLQLFYIEGHSQSEVAGILDLPVTTINNRLHSSRRRLRQVMADIIEQSPVSQISRSKERRRWLPANLSTKEAIMALIHDQTSRKLPRMDQEITIRIMTRDDIPAMRRLDDELAHAQVPLGWQSAPGGPWSDDQLLKQHFDIYEKAGNVTLLAEDESGKLVGFAELWAGHEPEPFGDSLNIECVDYLIDYYYAGIETILIEEAEKVARAAGLPSLDFGTNTASGDYPSLRKLGLKVFYEYDEIRCRCKNTECGSVDYQRMNARELDRSGLIKVDHYCPTDFYAFIDEPEKQWFTDFEHEGERVVMELPSHVRPGAELYVTPAILQSQSAMNAVLCRCAFISAGPDGWVNLPCPSDLVIDEALLEVESREYQFAWLRKTL